MLKENDKRIKLGVNVDHVATVREAREIDIPDPVEAAVISEYAGCDSIVMHLRQDRRHIKERDVKLAKKLVKTRFNLEMSILPEIVDIAFDISPHQVTFVPERRQEVTTEGGLDVVRNMERIEELTEKFQTEDITVSLFIAPEESQIKASAEAGAKFIEFHTGGYVNAEKEEKKEQLHKLNHGAEIAHSLDLRINAGHGLNYRNVKPITKIPYLEELNIGHSIISRAIFVGIEKAVKEMIKILRS